ncbi:shikimate dehydrogenase [Kitasatospora sp. NPDC051853]|uniref:shikimate dehydrogenase n=1 Tax=Kitasatospora sp. NPDC051853 TaxID=3364058 RepID=UPI0037948E32
MRIEQPPVLESSTPPRQAARRTAVLGSPVGQSITAALHRAGLTAMGLDWSYQNIECDETELPGVLAGLESGWAGFALGMPLKRAVLPLIDEVSDLGLDVGGVNTVVFRRGRSHGETTDVYGMLTALREAGVTSPGSAVVLGGGATACSALAALRELGVLEPSVVVRDRSRAAEATAAAGRLGIAVDVHTFGNLESLLPGAGLVVSTLPAGAADTFAAAVMHSRAAVFDVVTSAWPTRLVKAAGFAGSTVVDGVSFAVHQAARQLELLTGRGDVPIAALRRAAQEELLRRAD